MRILFGENYKSSGTGSGTRRKTTEQILELIKNNPQMTAPKIAIELGISTRGVEKSLRQLRETGIINLTPITIPNNVTSIGDYVFFFV
ncbi:MAG: winged helix-turn-helix domain-containing protein [Prevotella sp.]